MDRVIAPLPRDFRKGVFTPLFLDGIDTQKCSVYQASYHFIAIVNHQLRERFRSFCNPAERRETVMIDKKE